MADEEQLIEGIKRVATPLKDDADLDPLMERIGGVLPMRYDAMLYIDRSHALRPLKMTPQLADEYPETPETYPSGM